MGLLQYFGYGEELAPWVNQARLGEAFGNLRQRNQFSTLMSIGLLGVIYVTMRRQLRWNVLAVVVLLAFGNAASGSRTGALQWVAIVFLAIFWRAQGARRPLQISIIAFCVYASALFVLPWMLLTHTGTDVNNLITRFSEQAGCASRLVLWSNVLTLIAQEPWFGWGWGALDFAHYVTLYPGVRFCDILDNAHNLPLQLAVELGIPIALGVCGAGIWAVLRCKPWRETDPIRQMAWGVLAVIMLHSMLEYPLWYGPFQMAFGLCLWMLWSTSRNRAIGSSEGSMLASLVRVGLAAILLTAVAYAAWDYRRVSQIYLAPQARDKVYRVHTMEMIRGSWLFRNQVLFAELTTTPLTRYNGQWTFNTAMALLYYSPEPRVIEKVIESAVMLGRDDEALLHLIRYRAAFPLEYEKWRSANRLTTAPVD